MSQSLDQMITNKSYSMPFNNKDMEDAYKLGQVNLLIELNKMVKGMVVNGICKGIITEEELNDKLVEIENS